MARLDWDRLRRVRPLDGADARVDPDGGVLWDRAAEGPPLAPGVRRLREGIVVRRARERKAALALDPPAPLPPRPTAEPASGIECPRCKERVPARKLLLHLRVACEGRG